MKGWKKFAWLASIFLVAYFLPLGNTQVQQAILEANIRYDTQDGLEIQEYHPDGRLSPKVRRIDKAAIASIEPVPSFTQSVHGVKWYLAAARAFSSFSPSGGGSPARRSRSGSTPPGTSAC
jgi:hypothetical protein